MLSDGASVALREMLTSENVGIAIYPDQEISMPTLKVEMYEGRTIEQKRAFAEKVTVLVIETLGGTPEGVQVIFDEIKKENWATGGKLASDPKA